MLKGRLGLETARIPHADRHGLMWLARGKLIVENGTLQFLTAGTDEMAAGDYAIPLQLQHLYRAMAWLGEVLPRAAIEVLRGIEGARMKETYRRLAEQFRIPWEGRRYDRQRPEDADVPNQCINHAATAVEAAAMIAVSATGALPQLGFIHEDASISLCLDVSDLFRDSITLPAAFAAAREVLGGSNQTVDRITRRHVCALFRKRDVIPSMIDRIKELFAPA
jgi:CRISPR-associated protein Cas1